MAISGTDIKYYVLSFGGALDSIKIKFPLIILSASVKTKTAHLISPAADSVCVCAWLEDLLIRCLSLLLTGIATNYENDTNQWIRRPSRGKRIRRNSPRRANFSPIPDHVIRSFVATTTKTDLWPAVNHADGYRWLIGSLSLNLLEIVALKPAHLIWTSLFSNSLLFITRGSGIIRRIRRTQ